jgi:hypothetical protein
MAGLVPAIHVVLAAKDVDARHKAGHDGVSCQAEKPSSVLAAFRPARRPETKAQAR